MVTIERKLPQLFSFKKTPQIPLSRTHKTGNRLNLCLIALMHERPAAGGGVREIARNVLKN